MKLWHIPFLSIAFIWTACGSQANPTQSEKIAGVRNAASIEGAEPPHIIIEIQGAPAGPVNLIGIFEGQYYKADSAVADVSGRVVFQREAPYQPGMLFALYADRTTIQMLVDKDQTFTLKGNRNDLTGSMHVEGSLDNQLLYESLRFDQQQQPEMARLSQALKNETPGSPRYNELIEQRYQLLDKRRAYLQKLFEQYPSSFFTTFKKAGQNPDIRYITKPDGSLDTARYAYLYRRAFWDDVDFSDKRLLYTPVISNKLKRYITELTAQRPDSILQAAYYLVDEKLLTWPNYDPEYYKYFVNWIVLQYDPKESEIMDSEKIFVRMIQKYFTYDRAFWADSVEIYSLQQRAYEMASSLLGQKGPNVTAPGPDGKLYSLYDLTAPYIIVYMYNPQCEHCAVETPKLVNFYHEWKDKGVDVFGIALDTNHEEWVAYIEKNKMPWVNVFDPTNRAIYAKYFVDITPEMYVLNPDRILIGKNLKTHQLPIIIERDMRKRGTLK